MLGVSPHGHHQVIVDQAQPQLVGIPHPGKALIPKYPKIQKKTLNMEKKHDK